MSENLVAPAAIMEQHEPLATKPSSSTIGGISSPVIDRKQSSGDSDMERHLAAGIAKHSPQGEPPSHVVCASSHAPRVATPRIILYLSADSPWQQLVAKYTCVYRLFGWLFWGTVT